MFGRSIFGYLLEGLPRDLVAASVARHDGDRFRKRFKSYDHLVAMLAGQFSGASSLRELEVVLSDQAHHHYHLGFSGVKRSILSDANRSRPAAVFRDIAAGLMAQAGRRKRELRSVLSILDSSHIRLSGRGYDWAKETRTRGTCYGLKLHVQMHEEATLERAEVSATNISDLVWARNLPLEPGRLYVFDKGYCDYGWWLEIMTAGSDFVTRLKHNAAYRLVENRAPAGDILSDQIIELTNRLPRAGKVNRLAGKPLRLVTIEHPGGQSSPGSARPFRIVSSDLKSPAPRIAEAYRKRWAVELLFKWVKQNLKIKRFLGHSRNAVMIQIYVAIIAYILLSRFKALRGRNSPERMKDMLILISATLFLRPDIHLRRRRRKNTISILQPTLAGLSL